VEPTSPAAVHRLFDEISTGEETMTRTTQETKTTAEQHNLLATLVALRGDVMTEGDKLLSLSRDLILRQEYNPTLTAASTFWRVSGEGFD
jgi:hypothetical protein